jgi:hypothetical protein
MPTLAQKLLEIKREGGRGERGVAEVSELVAVR